jgi:hypothetical protein
VNTVANSHAWLHHHDLLDPAPMHLETGIQRREDGTSAARSAHRSAWQQGPHAGLVVHLLTWLCGQASWCMPKNVLEI